MRTVTVATMIALGLALTTASFARETLSLGERALRRVLRQAFPGIGPVWQARLVPDRTMAKCAAWKNQPPKEVGDAIKRRERGNLRYPEDGKFIGDWRRGERIAQSGYGMRFTDDDKARENGGNCYACHQLAPAEVSFGTVGVSLKGYGKLHKLGDADAKVVYEKIYNSQAIVACSLMPRFGANGILTIEQIKDLVAFLMDPESPVNQ